MSAEKWSY